MHALFQPRDGALAIPIAAKQHIRRRGATECGRRMKSWDEDPIRDAIAGDQEALSGLLERHGPALRSILAPAIPPQWQALISVDDVLQQTYTDAFLAISRFEPRGEGAFAAWLATMAQRNLADAIRAFQAEKRGGAKVDADAFETLFDRVCGDSDTPSRVAAREEQRAALLSALDNLPKLHRRVIREHDLEGRPISEIAAKLGRSIGAVHMIRVRALRWLSEELGGPSRFFSHFA